MYRRDILLDLLRTRAHAIHQVLFSIEINVRSLQQKYKYVRGNKKRITYVYFIDLKFYYHF